MADSLQTFIDNIKNDKRILTFNEDQAKMAIILPIMRRIGWDTENIDEVYPEFSVENRRVDYALRINNKSIVFVEAKRPSEDLDSGNHQEQLLDYCYRQGIELAVLTNGITWFLYLPTAGTDWKSRKFYTVDLKEQESDSVSAKFIELLSKKNIETGKAFQTARAIHKDKLKAGAIREALPIAWNRIIEGPDSLLIELLSESTEKISGYKPESSLVVEFLKSYEHKISITPYDEVLETEPRTGGYSLKKEKNSVNKPRGQKLYEHLEDYLIPVIKLMQDGYSHTEAFHQISSKLNVGYSTVSSQCSRGLNVTVDEFVQNVKSGRIKQILKNKFFNRTNLIDQSL
jgi:predicted type IV restriction endonuclease